MNSYQTFKSGPRAGQPRTLHDRVVRYLVEGLKFKEVENWSGKYRQFILKHDHGYQNYYVGKNGAVRAGRTVSDSVSLTDHIHARMVMWEHKLQAVVDKCNRTLERQELEAAGADGLINNLDRVIYETH